MGRRMPGDDREKQIRELAYAFWEQEGRPEGRAERHWRSAEIAVEAVEPGDHHSPYTIAAVVRRLEEEREFIEQGLGAREALQAVENALVDVGYDHVVVATERGTWTWESVGL